MNTSYVNEAPGVTGGIGGPAVAPISTSPLLVRSTLPATRATLFTDEDPEHTADKTEIPTRS